MLSQPQIILRNLKFHWRVHAAVALGVAAATAVLTGALLVGDSMRGSLKHLALDRLGQMDEILVANHFFRADLVQELSSRDVFVQRRAAAAPSILITSAAAESAAAESDGPARKRRTGGVQIIAVDSTFWDFAPAAQRPRKAPGSGEVILNETLAAELEAREGQMVILRFAKAAQVPADSALGRKKDRLTSLAELQVIEVIPAQGLGRFSLQPMQTAQRNAFVSLSDMQDALFFDEEAGGRGKINAIVLAQGENAPGSADVDWGEMLQPRLEDFGLALRHVQQTFGELGRQEKIFDYYSLSSEQMMLDDEVVAAVQRALGADHAPSVLTYLANSLERVPPRAGKRAEVPYSTITAIDSRAGGPLVDQQGTPLPAIADDEIVLNEWTAKGLGATPGDQIRVKFFEPETTHGDEREAEKLFRLKAIVPLTEPAKPYARRKPAVFTRRPTPANDPDLTPTVKGITDQQSIDDWDAPFRFDHKRVTDADEAYWDNHRTTPKAFVSLAKGQELWGSRFGRVTSMRITPSAAAGGGEEITAIADKIVAEFRRENLRLGMDFLPIKRQSLLAAAGTTPFDVLFLLLSMFIIAAALLLVWLLFRLGVEQRASELGVLLALGWPRGKIARLLLGEGAIVAALGASFGVLAGAGYAWLMLAGLRTWWIGAIATPFLQFHATPISLAIGYGSGISVSLSTIWISLRGLAKIPAQKLLAGDASAPPLGASQKPTSRFGIVGTALLFVAALGLAVLATNLGGEAQAGAFLAAGFAVLTALLLVVARFLRGSTNRGQGSQRSATSLLQLAVRNAGRNVGRSITTIALMAAASFLIVAVSSFRLDPSDAGVGGFDLIAESSEPIFVDLNQPQARQTLLRDQASLLEGTEFVALRLKPGDDASCRNLYQAAQPRVLGVSPRMSEHFAQSRVQFSFAGSAATTPQQRKDPWRLLASASPTSEPVSVILDKNTAMYSLKLYRGIGEVFERTYPDVGAVRFRVVGLLDSSVLQGSLLISEPDFKRLFPRISGQRVFLIKTPAGKAAEITAVLEDKLGDEGFDAVDARVRLKELLAVQNTYISTFQALGALGLVLGTLGLAAVQMRNVFERRKELALLRAAGFSAVRLGQMVLLENLLLLLGGLATGTLAALFSVLPHMLVGGAKAPLTDLLAMLAVVLVVGLLTGLLAIRATLRTPLLAALRGE